MRARLLVVTFAFLASACGDSAMEKLQALAAKDAPCTTTADCCVVFEHCHSTAYVVGAGDFSRAEKLVSEVDDSTCNRCMAAPVELLCVEGACVGRKLDFDDANDGNRVAHCGTVESSEGEENSPDPQTQSQDHDHEVGRTLGCGA